jgi:hypothetical protein
LSLSDARRSEQDGERRDEKDVPLGHRSLPRPPTRRIQRRRLGTSGMKRATSAPPGVPGKSANARNDTSST